MAYRTPGQGGDLPAGGSPSSGRRPAPATAALARRPPPEARRLAWGRYWCWAMVVPSRSKASQRDVHVKLSPDFRGSAGSGGQKGAALPRRLAFPVSVDSIAQDSARRNFPRRKCSKGRPGRARAAFPLGRLTCTGRCGTGCRSWRRRPRSSRPRRRSRRVAAVAAVVGAALSPGTGSPTPQRGAGPCAFWPAPGRRSS